MGWPALLGQGGGEMKLFSIIYQRGVRASGRVVYGECTHGVGGPPTMDHTRWASRLPQQNFTKLSNVKHFYTSHKNGDTNG